MLQHMQNIYILMIIIANKFILGLFIVAKTLSERAELGRDTII